jgi:succinyl-CoA synthetase beta subunit
VCESPEEIEAMSAEMFGKHLVTNQTGEKGQLVTNVLIHEGVNFANEFYIAFLLDRAYDGPCLMGSPMGGMDIEEVANEYPDQIRTIPIDIGEGLTIAKAREMAEFVGFSGKAVGDACEQLQNLYEMFMANDCVQVEINPMVQTTEEFYESKVYCVDAKLGFDDFAQFRNEEIFSWKDPSMEDPREMSAEEVGLNYVGLDGYIGCMVNGAGLAMATMDVIKLAGGEPANFLDVGGGANEKQVEAAFKILTSDVNVKGILINIFGGIMKCDVIANGVIAAAKTVDLEAKGIPLVVRLAGTNVNEGKALLDQSGLPIQSASDLDDAAAKIVASVNK